MDGCQVQHRGWGDGPNRIGDTFPIQDIQFMEMSVVHTCQVSSTE